MQTVSKLLDQVVQDNPNLFRIFSPDKLESNKLNEVFKHTCQNFQWDQYSNAQGARVVETLSEHQR
jgi:xylulose-5-phosphate/fructose-6-phosphate phosphoketolase